MTNLRDPETPTQESGAVDALTCIRRRIQCAATPEATGHEYETEFDRIAIDNLLDTLAEVALAIVRRREQLDP